MDANAINARKRARRLAMQALYQWQLSSMAMHDIERQFLEQEDFSRTDRVYFQELIGKIAAEKAELLALAEAEADRPADEIDPVELAVLYIALYELKYRLDVPYRAVLNEAIDLAKKFGAAESYKYVNGILDKAAKKLRVTETGT